MAETHELRLKIDAAAAKRGSREFTAAINAVKMAVRDLERDTTGSFTKLRKNMDDLSKTGKVNIGIDRQALRTLDSFSKAQQRVVRDTVAGTKSTKALTGAMRSLSSAYGAAKGSADAFTASVQKGNTALERQARLAGQVNNSMRQTRAAPTVSTASSGSGGASKAATDVEAAQSRIQRAVAQSRTTVESLTVALMKMGNFGGMSQLHRDFAAFQQTASKTGVTTKELASAKDRLATSISNARTSLVTLTAQQKEETRATKEAQAAAAGKAASDRTVTAALNERNAAQTRSQNAQISASAAMRRSEADALRLNAALKGMGNSAGITRVNQSLIALKAALSGGNASAQDVKRAMDMYAASTQKARTAIIRFNASQTQAAAAAQRMAAANREAANSARRVEQEMRSIAGASNAANQSFRRATGNVRGLENAFSSTYQAGSLFRNMMGSITLGTFIASVFQAGDALDQFRVSMEVATGSAAGGLEELNYIDSTAARLGVSLKSARDNYAKFAISSDIAGVSGEKTRRIFESVSTAMAVLGKSSADQNLAFMALEQMMSKGKVSSEELRRQLGERLPGAVNMMAQALGVGVDELQKMLKLGQINSADALPKFAEVLMDRFGPGLEKAARRAGNNLQKFRNEVDKFQEETAQAGFMQELAAQFRMLTDTLASGVGTDAAQQLGQALAGAARVGGEALGWLIENIEKVGTALKAIGFGIVLRQLMLFGAAITTTGMRLTGYAAAALNGGKAQTAAQIAAAKHTAALTANTAALTAQTAASTRTTVSTAAQIRAQEMALRSAMNGAAGTSLYARAIAALGLAATGTTARLATLSRVMGATAGIAGIAITALLLIPGAFDALGGSASKMESAVNASLARAGVAFDEFEDQVKQTASEAELGRLLRDLDNLEHAANRLANVGQGRGGLLGMFIMDDELAATSAVRQLGEEMSTVGRLANDFTRIISGFGSFDESAVSAGAASAAREMLTDYAKLGSVQGDAIALQNKLNDARLRYPSAGPLLDELGSLINRQVKLEQGIQNTDNALTRLYGSETERMSLEFAEAAVQVMKTGEGMDELNKKQAVLAKMSPEVANNVAEIASAMHEASMAGDSPLAFMQSVSGIYGETVDRIRDLRQEVRETEAAFGEASDAMEAAFKESLTRIFMTDGNEDAMGFQPIDPSAIESYERLMTTFQEFQSGGGLQLAAEGVRMFAEGLTAATPAAVSFREQVLAQFEALNASEQTYTRLDSIVRQVASTFPASATGVAQMSTALLANARAGDDAAMSATDLKNRIAAIDWGSDAARDAALAAAGFGNNVQTAGNQADAASAGMYNAANAADSIGGAAGSATVMVNGLAQALANLGALDMGAMASNAIKGMNQQITLKALGPAARMAKQIEQTARNEVSDLFGKATEGVDPRMDAGAWGDAVNLRNQQLDSLEVAMEGVRNTSEVLANTKAGGSGGGRGGGGRGRGGGGGRGRGGGGGGGEKTFAGRMADRLDALNAEKQALDLVASGQFKTEEAARLMAEAMVKGGGAVDEQTRAMIDQIDAASALNEELQKVAKDPVKEWMKSVPNWIAAGQQIEMGAIESLKGALSEFIKTGEFDINALGESILGMVADIVADKAMKELMTMLGRGGGQGLGGILGGLFGSVGDMATGPTMGGGADVAQGGVQAGQTISQAMVQAGQQVSQSIGNAMNQGGQMSSQQVRTGMQQGGQAAASAQRTAGTQSAAQLRTATMTSGMQHATDVRTAITTAGGQHASAVATAAGAGGGGAGGGLLSGVGGWQGLLSMGLGMFSQGGMATDPVERLNMRETNRMFDAGLFAEGGMAGHAMSHTSAPAASFRSAPHYSAGTSNTSGIPAVLHPNEAVIPLSKGRKIPVDMGENAGGSSKTVMQTFNISTPDADSFRRSQKQIAADGANAAQRALSSNR